MIGKSDVTKSDRFSGITLLDGIICWTIGMPLIISAIPHWGNPYFFLGSIYAYQMVSPGIGQMVAMVFPLLQMITAICLLGRFFIDEASVAATLLFLGFATVQTTAVIRGLDISCGCFGPGHDSPIGWFTLSLVYGLLCLSVLRNTIRFSQPKELCPLESPSASS